MSAPNTNIVTFNTSAEAVAKSPAAARALHQRYELMEFLQKHFKARSEAKEEILGSNPEEIKAVLRGCVNKFTIGRMQELLDLNGVDNYPR